MVCNIEFKRFSSKFQSNPSKDIKRNNEDTLLFIPVDKTNNLFKLSKDNYNKLLKDNITKSYKKTNTAAVTDIKEEAKCTSECLHFDDTIEQFNQCESFVTPKN